MAHKNLLYKNPKVDLKRKYPKLEEIGLILALGLLTILFYAFKDFEPAYHMERSLDITIITEEIPRTEPYKKLPPPDNPRIPEPSENPDLPDYIPIWTSEVDFNSEIETQIPNEEEPEVPFPNLSEKPEVIERIIPEYPKMARQLGITGNVFVEVLINTSGDVEEAKVVSGNEMLNDAALEAILKWKFKPGIQWNRPVKVRMVIPVQFKLK